VQDSLSKHLHRFTPAQRISRSVGFGACLKSNVLSDKNFKLFFMPNNIKNARLGIVVAKRKLPRSVDRNNVKRHIRELFRNHQIKFASVDLVVMARNGEKTGLQGLNTLFTRLAIRCTDY
jgi:ribonuclease P protein component